MRLMRQEVPPARFLDNDACSAATSGPEGCSSYALHTRHDSPQDAGTTKPIGSLAVRRFRRSAIQPKWMIETLMWEPRRTSASPPQISLACVIYDTGYD